MKFYVTIVLFVFVFIACNESNDHQEAGSKDKSEIEKIELETFEGKKIDLAKTKEKAVFINFWATWCKPCVMEMPTIKNAMEALKNENIEFVFATDETAEQVQKFEATHHFGFNYVRALNMDALNISVLPTTFIFNKDGRQVFSDMGYRKWDEQANIDLIRKAAK